MFFDKLQSGSATLDEQGLVLIPSLRGWPHVMVKHDPGLPVVIHYLVQEDTEGGARSQDELRRRLVALAEPERWELCRHLICESITTGELAIRTGLPKSAVSRHLRSLREAGLISSQNDGRQVFHRLHPAAVVHLGHDVLRGIMELFQPSGGEGGYGLLNFIIYFAVLAIILGTGGLLGLTTRRLGRAA